VRRESTTVVSQPPETVPHCGRFHHGLRLQRDHTRCGHHIVKAGRHDTRFSSPHGSLSDIGGFRYHGSSDSKRIHDCPRSLIPRLRFPVETHLTSSISREQVTLASRAINNNTAGAQLQVTVANFAAGQIVNCSVAMTITDTSSPTQTVNVTGTLQVTIKAETFISVNFLDYDWNISLSSPAEPQSGSIILNSLMSLPLLGHSPFTYTVDTVTIAGGLGSFVQKSPTNRVLAFNLNETAASVSIADVDQTLTSTGFYTVTATNLASAPAPGTYVVTVHMTVTDNKGIQSAATQHVNVKVSA
jgi:hypothetical protein